MAYESKIKTDFIDQLFAAILLLENEEECYRFFEDLATVGELNALAQRLEVCKMLVKNDTYLEISEKTGASAATVSRVKKSLNYGADGYKIILKRLEEKD